MNCHERLKKLNMYSLERRRERYMIIYGWQQLEGIKENILRLETRWRGRGRMIMPKKIRYAANGKLLSVKERGQIFNSPAGKVQRLFNCIFSYTNFSVFKKFVSK
ncbi:MAG: hypothetical protein GY775_18840 [Candidatus Scalindua sp.]|nr:hypothetical protein [Candidatus Scalindua sp.]